MFDYDLDLKQRYPVISHPRGRLYLSVIKARRPLTPHISSITITTKKYTGYKDAQAYSANYKATQDINIV